MDGFAGQLPRVREFETIWEYSDAIVEALERHATEVEPITAIPTRQLRGSDSASDRPVFFSLVKAGSPVILQGAMEGWPALNWSPALLTQQFGDVQLSCRRGSTYADMEDSTTSLSEFVKQCSASTSSTGGTCQPAAAKAQIAHACQPHCGNGSAVATAWYAANNPMPPAMAADLGLPPLFPPHVFRSSDIALWIGPSGSGTPFHRDLQDNFIAQVCGSKELLLAPPHAAAQLHPVKVTPFLETIEHALNRKQQGFLSCRLEPGDMLFLPAGWWHQVHNTSADDQLCCSVNFFASACFAAVGVLLPQLC